MDQDIAPIVFVPYNLTLPRSPQRRRLRRKHRQHLSLPPSLPPPVVFVLAQIKRLAGSHPGKVDVAPLEPAGVSIRWPAPDVDVVRTFIAIRNLVSVVGTRCRVPPETLRPETARHRWRPVDDFHPCHTGANEVRFICVLRNGQSAPNKDSGKAALNTTR